jgi:ABC-type transport system involved in multi-copper enzyme maturation permease subunit
VTLRERIGALNRLQKTRWFKIVASVVVAVVGISIATTYAVTRAAQRAEQVVVNDEAVRDIRIEDAKTDEEKALAERVQMERTSAEAAARVVNDILRAKADPTGFGVMVGIGVGLALAVIWMGLGLTSLAAAVLLALLALPPWYLGNRYDWPRVRGLGLFIGAVGVLSFAFVVLMEVLRAALSGSNPVLSIAKNVVNEAVRMKVSLVFIVMLLLALAALPGLLDPSTPLRYRVQAFLQYGTGGAFWIIAVLVLLLSVGTVAFEQRDKIIWQTMTKPVAAWQYLLGKWLGVAGVAAVLLGVSSAGVFLFTEYLRDQRAMGEVSPYVGVDNPNDIAEDRFVLETQVLSARQSVGPEIPKLTDESLVKEVKTTVEKLQAADPQYSPGPEQLAKIAEEIEKQRVTQFLTLEGGGRRSMQFVGLQEVKRLNRPITLRYRVSVGADDPRYTHKVSFLFPNVPPRVQQVPLGQAMSLDISPVAISEKGVLDIEVINGDFFEQVATDQTMSFPPDGIEVFYPVGTYRSNFFRAMTVLWLKLAMLAMVGVCAATFLSFSVASLVAFGTFFIAESTGFLIKSLDYFSSETTEGGIDFFRLIVRAIAVPIAKLFQTYSELAPTANLVDGRMLSWGQVILAVVVLGLVTAVLYVVGVIIFQRRELATYSGQ